MRTPIATRTSAISFVAFSAALITSFAVAATSRVDDSNAIIVTDVVGTVSVTTAGVDVDVRVDSTLGLPSRVVTGHDGTLGIKQAHTSISIAPDSEIAIPAEAADGNLIARLVQYRGNAFYDVAPREASKLHVETPFLVAVIKGTQFNVAVGDDSTTISLFEGRLEIHTPDESEVIELAAGEIAIRGRADSTIRVIGMDEDRLPAPRAEAAVAADATVAASSDATGSWPDSNAVEVKEIGTSNATASAALPIAESTSTTLLAADLDLAKPSATVDTGIVVNLATSSADVDSGISLGGTTENVELSARLELPVDTTVGDLGGATDDFGVDADAELDLGLGDKVVGGDVGVDLSVGDLDVGADLSVNDSDLGIDLGDDEPLIDILPPAPPPGDDKDLGGLLGRIL